MINERSLSNKDYHHGPTEEATKQPYLQSQKTPKTRGDSLSKGPKLRKDCRLLNLAVFDTVPPVFDTRPSP